MSKKQTSKITEPNSEDPIHKISIPTSLVDPKSFPLECVYKVPKKSKKAGTESQETEGILSYGELLKRSAKQKESKETEPAPRAKLESTSLPPFEPCPKALRTILYNMNLLINPNDTSNIDYTIGGKTVDQLNGGKAEPGDTDTESEPGDTEPGTDTEPDTDTDTETEPDST